MVGIILDIEGILDGAKTKAAINEKTKDQKKAEALQEALATKALAFAQSQSMKKEASKLTYKGLRTATLRENAYLGTVLGLRWSDLETAGLQDGQRGEDPQMKTMIMISIYYIN